MRLVESLFIGSILCTAILVPTTSQAVRPPNGGLFAYSDADELTYLDGEQGRIRVHYSLSGPNAAPLDDADDDGRPDFVTTAAEVGEAALQRYVDELGFLPPLDDTSLDVYDDGGSSAVDIYLVDFGGQADGNFSIDDCIPTGACSGALIVENDFRGYGYRSAQEALETVVSHELFHAIEAAYVASTPIWVSEGMAVWAERQFEPASRDFLAFVRAYLEETDRPFHRPPGGPVPYFAYGVGLWWEFLSLEVGHEFIERYLHGFGGEVFDDDDALAWLITALESEGRTLDTLWDRFALMNLATSDRSGALESYHDAEQMLGLVVSDLDASDTTEATRYYPLTAHYYSWDHRETMTFLGASKRDPHLRGILVAADERGVPIEVTRTFSFDELPLRLTAEGAEPGRQYLVITNSSVGTNSVRTELCFGESSEALQCLSEDPIGGGGESEQAQDSTDTGCTQSQTLELWGLLSVWLLIDRRRFTARSEHT